MTARPFTNRLARETSPYLLQHARNPVDWHPWDARALALAQTEDKPIFLSIGYSACHWCHVMERESFEDAETAAYLNAHFVNIKVDREERPDLDAIYMDAVQLMTRQGGWPMSVFLMPDGTPFHGGTYFPPTPRQGLPSFRQVLEAVAEAFARRRDDLQAHGVKMVAHLDALSAPAPAGALDREGLLAQARTQLAHVFDAHYGGFGRAPKFPQPMTLDFLLAQAHDAGDRQARQMAEVTLTRMLNGGIYDQLGGGFHRYSVDAYWLVPHFEKMLYDNAQLLVTYLHAWQLTGQPDYRRTVLETIDYVLREMTHPEGGFYSAQDADSEGEEGTFFLWSREEMEAALGQETAQVACLALGATARGNFEGRNILHRPLALEECSRRLRLPPERLQAVLQEARRTLLQVRERRPRPARDDKILVEWNGLLIYALAQCGTVLPHEPALAAARRAADFIWERLRAADGRLRRSYKDGQAKFNGYLEDYAAYGRALLALFEADTNPVWLQRSQAVAATMRAEFEDAEGGAFFQTGHSHEKLVLRRKDFMDNAVPSGNSLAAAFLIRLAHIAGHAPYRASADRVFCRVGELMGAQPTAFGCLLAALQDRDAPTQEVIVVGDPDAEATRALLHAARQSYHPRRFVAHLRPNHASDLPLLAGKTAAGGVPAAYVCRNQTCHAPVTNVTDLLALMQAAPAAPRP